MATYLRQSGTNEVFMVDNTGAHYVPANYATQNNIFPEVQVVNYRIDTKYPIAEPLKLEGTGATTSSGSTEPPKPFDYKKYGISDTDWQSLSDAERAFFESTAKILQSQYDQGQSNASINAKLFSDAMEQAKNDPEIQAKYGDSLRINQGSLERNLGMINEEFGQTMGLLSTKQEEERKALAESEAQAGRAFSGFREQAKQRLGAEQSGVIASSRRALQRTLNETGQTLEQKYGTAGLGQFAPITAGGLTYKPIEGLTGTIAGEQKDDIYNRAVSSYNQTKL